MSFCAREPAYSARLPIAWDAPRYPAYNKERGDLRADLCTCSAALEESMMMMRLGLLIALLFGGIAQAQDVPGIELCARESNMDRRTGCLQSNVDYLQKLIARNAATAQQKLDAANVEIAALKAAVASLQASVDKLQSAATKPDSSAKPDAK
jgi:hypothetical protein